MVLGPNVTHSQAQACLHSQGRSDLKNWSKGMHGLWNVRVENSVPRSHVNIVKN